VFWVRVPVLSEHTTEVVPSVSTGDKRLAKALLAAILRAPSVRTIVTTVGKPSGMAATDSEIAAFSISRASIPFKMPMPMTIATTIRAAAMRMCDRLSMRSCSGS
jgi:hypothetical protein